MSTINSIALKAYLQNLNEVNSNAKEASDKKTSEKGFLDTIEDSLKKVNELQIEKEELIKEFAVGKNQNIHELMIAIQKASVAVKLTAAVRNKVLEAYKQMMNMPI